MSGPDDDLAVVRPGPVALGVSATATAVVLVGFHALGPGGRLVGQVVAIAAFASLLVPRVGRTVTPRAVAITGLVLGTVAVLVPPRGSLDVWSYALYGRMLVVHHVSPFTHGPARVGPDPLLHLVARRWRHTASVYGPAFVAVAAVVTRLAGVSAVATRSGFQLLEAAALGACGAIVWQRTRNAVAFAFVVVNPALVAVVNGAHNDLLVGLALLAGTVLLVDGGHRGAGVVLALGALVKVVLVVPAAALVLWEWRRRGPRRAAETGAVFAAGLVLGYGVAGGVGALHPLVHASGQHAAWSVWHVVRAATHRWGLPPVPTDLESLVALALVGVVVLLVAVRPPRLADAVGRPDPTGSAAVVATASLLPFLLAATWVLPWYGAWVLPVAALALRSRGTLLALAQAALVTIAPAATLLARRIDLPDAGTIVPLLLVVATGALVWWAARGHLDGPLVAPLGSARRPRRRERSPSRAG